MEGASGSHSFRDGYKSSTKEGSISIRLDDEVPQRKKSLLHKIALLPCHPTGELQ